MAGCLFPAWFSGLEAPIVNSNDLVQKFRERIESEEFHRNLQSTEYESSEEILHLWLNKSGNDLDLAINTWHSWVEWRHKIDIDKISNEDIINELDEGIIRWEGKNKEGMRCCILTGRMLNPKDRLGTPESFKKFISKSVEDNLKESLYLEEKKVCIIYDRRGLTYDNIDPNLYNYCLSTISLLKDFHYDRIGALYIVHTNWFFWALYNFIVSPIFNILGPKAKLIVVEKPEELLQYFDPDQLFLDSLSCEESEENKEQNSSDED